MKGGIFKHFKQKDVLVSGKFLSLGIPSEIRASLAIAVGKSTGFTAKAHAGGATLASW